MLKTAVTALCEKAYNVAAITNRTKSRGRPKRRTRKLGERLLDSDGGIGLSDKAPHYSLSQARVRAELSTLVGHRCTPDRLCRYGLQLPLHARGIF